MAPLVILCFHRIVEDDDLRAWPYLLRGTAVRRSTFETQLRALRERGSFVDPLDPWARHGVDSERPRFWITFDDGYRDTVLRALPAMRAIGARASVFVTTEVALGRRFLPADEWYAVLLAAQRRDVAVCTQDWRVEANLDDEEGRRRLVMGPERRAFLQADERRQRVMLDVLARALAAKPAPLDGLYMDREDLETLRREGWCLGSHGATHAILPTLSSDALTRELSLMVAGLDRLEVAVTYLAWPDGQHSEETRAYAHSIGVRYAFSLGDEAVSPTSDSLALPRFIVPDDPSWLPVVCSIS